MTTGKGPKASEEERKERRRAANRRSARKSRYRENIVMEELRKSLTVLSNQNKALKSENESFRQDLAMLQGLMQLNVEYSLDQKCPVENHADDSTVTPTCLCQDLHLQRGQVSPPDEWSQGQFKAVPMLPESLNICATDNLKSMVMAPRTISPVDSFSLHELNPDRIFPVKGEVNKCDYYSPIDTAQSLLMASMAPV